MVGQAVQKTQALRDDFNATNLRNVRYGIQRVFLSFLDDCRAREEQVANGRGEIVFDNFGKFTQVITDFETIHYYSKPVDLYAAFASFLEFQAEDAYPEGWQDNQYANPDAVRIMTVPQAKGCSGRSCSSLPCSRIAFRPRSRAGGASGICYRETA